MRGILSGTSPKGPFGPAGGDPLDGIRGDFI